MPRKSIDAAVYGRSHGRATATSMNAAARALAHKPVTWSGEPADVSRPRGFTRAPMANALIVAFGKKKGAPKEGSAEEEAGESPEEETEEVDEHEKEAIQLALGTDDEERIKAFKVAVKLCMQQEKEGEY